ncbi:hypothetical protein C10C_0452 [Chlamydia serpentis]|uniref:Lipoprotein n=1 Tax=Chlamydia serpentis TaxID=1967782 RepID=A0A2R8FB11_9CHLA|nr:hypothetical protein [Chlamydia serpentis]SPN73618.1 hypothetical protein C10C_0452 [Chlamydia serpentis]
MNRKKTRWVVALFAMMALISVGCCPWSQPKSRCSVQKYVPVINRLLEICGLPEAEAIEDLIESTSTWILSPEERFSGDLVSNCQLHDEHAFYNDLSLLHMTQALPAYSATYDCAVIFGGPLPALRQRLDFLIREWQRGVRFKKIVFLCGQRGRYKSIEEQEHFFDSRYNPFPMEDNWQQENHSTPASEEEIAKFVWTQMLLPTAWRDNPSAFKVVFLVAKPAEDRLFANRKDTLLLFRSYQEDFSGRVLFVSSQPFIGLDSCRVEKFFKSENYDIAGPGFAQGVLKYHWAPRICLHTLAEWLKETNGCLNISEGYFG